MTAGGDLANSSSFNDALAAETSPAGPRRDGGSPTRHQKHKLIRQMSCVPLFLQTTAWPNHCETLLTNQKWLTSLIPPDVSCHRLRLHFLLLPNKVQR